MFLFRCSNIPIICNQIGGNLEILRITRPIEIKSIVMVLGWYIIKPVFFVVVFYRKSKIAAGFA